MIEEVNLEYYPNAVRLTNEQVDFYKANPAATWGEVSQMALNPMTAEELKLKAIQRENENFSILLKQGFSSERFDITLAIEESDRTAFSNLIVMLSLYNDSEKASMTIPVSDINGILKAFSYTDLVELLKAYGQYYQTIWTMHKAEINRIESLT